MTAPIQSPAGPTGTGANPLTNAVVGGPMGKNEFIKLLVAQMTHQDPLNPTDGQEMAAQLAQFSSVEQLVSIGDKLDGLSSGNAAMLAVANNAAAMNLVGRDMTVTTDQITLGGADATKSLSVDVPEPGGALSMRILSSSGTVLRTVPLGNAPAGTRSIDLAHAGDGLPAGTYTIEVVSGEGATATTLPAHMMIHADGVRFGRDGTFVTSGSLSFPIGAITSIGSSSPAHS